MIQMAAAKDQARRQLDNFLQIYKVKYSKAAERLKKDRDVLLTFYNFSTHPSNSIESIFSTVRLRTDKVRGYFFLHKPL